VADEVTAERSLILAATRPSGHSREVVDRALRSEVDWECLIRLALRHRLAPPLLAVLTSADAGLVPEEILDALRFYCSVLREHSEQLRTQLFQLLDALDRRSVVAVPFKGPVLADLLYGDIAFRSLCAWHEARVGAAGLGAGYRWRPGEVPGDRLGAGCEPGSRARLFPAHAVGWGYYVVRLGADFAVLPMWKLAKSLKLASSGRNS